MQSIERIKSLDIKSLATVSERDAKSTDFVAWWYPQAPKGAGCNSSNTNQPLAPGVEQLLQITLLPELHRNFSSTLLLCLLQTPL